jgi:hypothetical protein
MNRPYLEFGCLAHLAIAAPLSGLSASAALAFSEEAVTIAEAHGLATNPIVALAFAIGAGSLAWLGRFDEAEQWLERAVLALRSGGDPGTELALHHARGLLYSGQGRLEDALAEFRNGEKVQGMLAGEHALMVDLRARIMLTQVRMGALSDARAALDSIAEQDRDRAEVRLPAAAIYVAEGSPEEAIELLAPRSSQRSTTCAPAILRRRRTSPHSCWMSSVRRSSVSLDICSATSGRRRSPPNCSFRRTRSGPTCATSMPSWMFTTAPRRSPAPEGSASSHPPIGAARERRCPCRSGSPTPAPRMCAEISSADLSGWAWRCGKLLLTLERDVTFRA